MLVSFSLENWKSFKEPVKLSLVDAKCPRKGRVIPRDEKYDVGLLPLVSIYGGNASGKSNLVKAISFAQDLVVNGMESKKGYETEPFLLDEKSKSLPTKFKFVLLIGEILYEYAFSIISNNVLSESLSKIHGDNSQISMFEREGQKFTFGNEIETETLNQLAETTLEQRLFLCHSAYFKLEQFRPITDWFENSLLVIDPESKFVATHKLVDAKNPLVDRINNTLFMLDTGVIGINKEELSPELIDTLITNEIIPIDKLKVNGTINFGLGDRNFSANFQDNVVKAFGLVAQHKTITGQTANFDFSQESDGTIRLIDLIPAFFELTQSSGTFVLVVDELDRSLHTFLTKSLIKSYLELCNQESKMQLIYTTHDTSLIEELPIRNDEICVTDRDMDGITRLVSIGDFKDIKADDNILELYKKGRVGGIPSILFKNTAINPFDNVVLKGE